MAKFLFIGGPRAAAGGIGEETMDKWNGKYELLCRAAKAACRTTALVLAVGLVSTSGHAQAQGKLTPIADLVVSGYSGTYATGAINPVTNKLYLVGLLTWMINGQYQVGYKLMTVDLTTKVVSIVSDLGSVGNSSTIQVAFNPAKNTVYVAIGRDLVVVDGDTHAAQRLVFPQFSDALDIKLAVNRLTNQVFVLGGSYIVQIDGETRAVAASTTVNSGQYPTLIGLNERDNIVYISYQFDTSPLTAIKSTTNPTTKQVTLSAADYPSGSNGTWGHGTFNPVTNKLYYAPYQGLGLKEMDGASHQVTSLAVPNYISKFVVNPVSNRIYAGTSLAQSLSGNDVAVVDGISRAVEKSLNFDDQVYEMRVNSGADKVYVLGGSSLSIIDGPTKTVTKIDLPDHRLFVDPPPFVHPVTNQGYVISGNKLYEIVDQPPNPVVDAIEITQSVQDLAHSVPLIATKGTLVRVYVHSASTSITGVLTVKRDTGGTSTVSSLNPMAPTNDDLATRRKDLAKSLNFVLPSTSTSEGRIQVALSSLSDGSNFGSDGCTGCSRVVTFQPPLEMRLRVIGLKYQSGNNPAYAPRDVDFDLLQSWLKRAYPISMLTYSANKSVLYLKPTLDCTNANSQLTDIRNQDIANGRDKRTHYYGLVSYQPGAPGSFVIVGCSSGQAPPNSPDPSVVASGPAGPPPNSYWDTGASVAGWYAGHELGHTLGRWHAGPVAGVDPRNKFEVGPCTYAQATGANQRCDPTPPCNLAYGPDHNYPYPASQLAGPSGAFVGYDAGDVSNSLPSKALPSPMWHDMMSYCDYQWPSDYTYRGLMDRLRAENALPARLAPVPFAAGASISSPPFPASASGEASGAGAPMAAAASAPASIMLMGAPIWASGDFITIVGTANVTRRTGTIDFVHRVQQANVRPPDPASPVRLRLIDRAGATIADVPAPFLPNSDLRSGEDVDGVVDAAIPASADLKAVELVVAGNVAARYEAPATVRLDATEIRTPATPPTPMAQGAAAGRGLRLEWGNLTAAAAPTAGIRYDVQASRDGGQTWEVVANGLPSASAEVDLSEFDNIREIEVRVIANAGFESKVIAQRKIAR